MFEGIFVPGIEISLRADRETSPNNPKGWLYVRAGTSFPPEGSVPRAGQLGYSHTDLKSASQLHVPAGAAV